jgi:hypothetical protein
LDADEQAVRKDLPGLHRFTTAADVRIGQPSAVMWPEADLDAVAVVAAVNFTVIHVKGKDLIRKPTKTGAGNGRHRRPPGRSRCCADGPAATEDQHGPVFPGGPGGLRDPNNTPRDLRNSCGGEEFARAGPRVFGAAVATILGAAASVLARRGRIRSVTHGRCDPRLPPRSQGDWPAHR